MASALSLNRTENLSYNEYQRVSQEPCYETISFIKEEALEEKRVRFKTGDELVSTKIFIPLEEEEEEQLSLLKSIRNTIINCLRTKEGVALSLTVLLGLGFAFSQLISRHSLAEENLVEPEVTPFVNNNRILFTMKHRPPKPYRAPPHSHL